MRLVLLVPDLMSDGKGGREANVFVDAAASIRLTHSGHRSQSFTENRNIIKTSLPRNTFYSEVKEMCCVFVILVGYLLYWRNNKTLSL